MYVGQQVRWHPDPGVAPRVLDREKVGTVVATDDRYADVEFGDGSTGNGLHVRFVGVAVDEPLPRSGTGHARVP